MKFFVPELREMQFSTPAYFSLVRYAGSMTLEELVVVAQHGLEAIRRDMATKDELTTTESNILRSIEKLDCHLLTLSYQWNGHIERIEDQLAGLERRVNVLEKTSKC
jgi:hypothetical protein